MNKIRISQDGLSICWTNEDGEEIWVSVYSKQGKTLLAELEAEMLQDEE